MFDRNEFANLEPFNDRNPDRFYQKVAEFAGWITTLPTDRQLELHITVAPFDTTARAWSYREFTADELSTMVPCHRLIVGCTDVWGSTVEHFEYGTIQPPADTVDDPDFSWGSGLYTALQQYAVLACAAQAAYMEKVFAAHNFDYTQFLADTVLAPTEVVRDLMEAMMYVCQLETEVAQVESVEGSSVSTKLTRDMTAVLRANLYLQWDQIKQALPVLEDEAE